MEREKVITRLDKLIARGEELEPHERLEIDHWEIHEELGKAVPVGEYYTFDDDTMILTHKQWQLSCLNLLRLVFSEQSAFYKEFDKAERVGMELAALKAALDEIKAGFTVGLKGLIAADFFSTVLDQAEYLLDEKHKDPAAVLARVALEQTLRELTKREGLASADSDKAATLNEKLRKAGVYSKAIWRQVQAWLDIGNFAAHGKFDNYDGDQVGRMISGMRMFIDKLSSS